MPAAARTFAVLGLAVALTTGTVATHPTPAVAATSVPGDPLRGSGSTGRSLLTSTDLTTGTSTAPVADSAFALPAQAAPPSHQFEGTLTLQGTGGGGFKELVDTYNRTAWADNAWKHLPPFSVTLVQNGSFLVPTVRGLRITGSPTYNLVAGAGRVWNETSDGGRTRAALPFALVERNANCVHNGVLTFLFDDSSISRVRYQVTQETCEYQKFDMWGQLAATYGRQVVANGDQIRDAYAAEVSRRLPTKSISALATDYPSAGLDLSRFGAGVTAADMTKYGVYVNGVNYVSGCVARYGAYAFCDAMTLPSYSTGKSALVGVAYLRLAQLYGSGVAAQTIGSLVPETASAAGVWSDVTLNNGLDMATGNYDLPGFEDDEKGPKMSTFFTAETYRDKMSAALVFGRRAAPGTTWNYHTSDSFLTFRAEDAIVKARRGSSADAFSMVRDEVYTPIGVSPDSLTTVRTDNSAAGVPFGGYGLFWTTDDFAKVARLLNNDGGARGGSQLLSPAALAATMQRDPADRGLTTSGPTPFKYNNQVWAKQFTPTEYPQLACSFWVPFMSGFGGISAAMAPNGATYYYFSDNDQFSWGAAVNETGKINRLC